MLSNLPQRQRLIKHFSNMRNKLTRLKDQCRHPDPGNCFQRIQRYIFVPRLFYWGLRYMESCRGDVIKGSHDGRGQQASAGRSGLSPLNASCTLSWKWSTSIFFSCKSEEERNWDTQRRQFLFYFIIPNLVGGIIVSGVAVLTCVCVRNVRRHACSRACLRDYTYT